MDCFLRWIAFSHRMSRCLPLSTGLPVSTFTSTRSWNRTHADQTRLSGSRPSWPAPSMTSRPVATGLSACGMSPSFHTWERPSGKDFNFTVKGILGPIRPPSFSILGHGGHRMTASWRSSMPKKLAMICRSPEPFPSTVLRPRPTRRGQPRVQELGATVVRTVIPCLTCFSIYKRPPTTNLLEMNEKDIIITHLQVHFKCLTLSNWELYQDTANWIRWQVFFCVCKFHRIHRLRNLIWFWFLHLREL